MNQPDSGSGLNPQQFDHLLSTARRLGAEQPEQAEARTAEWKISWLQSQAGQGGRNPLALSKDQRYDALSEYDFHAFKTTNPQEFKNDMSLAPDDRHLRRVK